VGPEHSSSDPSVRIVLGLPSLPMKKSLPLFSSIPGAWPFSGSDVLPFLFTKFNKVVISSFSSDVGEGSTSLLLPPLELRREK